MSQIKISSCFFIALFFQFGFSVNKTCNPKLLKSYDLQSSHFTFSYPNIICPQIKENCCSYRAQVQIFRKWVIDDEFQQIDQFYKAKTESVQNLLKALKRVENEEKSISQQRQRCKAAFRSFREKSIDIDKVTQYSTQAFEFLYYSRKGFYCSLCNADEQIFYEFQNKEVQVSEKFCKTFADKAIDFYYWLEVELPEITKDVYGFLLTCNRSIPQQYKLLLAKLLHNKKFSEEIISCKKQGKCEGFCKNFTVTKLSNPLEGFSNTFNQVASMLNKILKKSPIKQHLMKKKQENLNPSKSDSKSEELPSGIITEKKYDYSDDATVKSSLNSKSVKSGVEYEYDLERFKTVVSKNGINFYKDGKSARIDKESIKDVSKHL